MPPCPKCAEEEGFAPREYPEVGTAPLRHETFA